MQPVVDAQQTSAASPSSHVCVDAPRLLAWPRPNHTGPHNRSTFELARAYGEVIGIDLSQTFIDMANKMKADGQVRWRRRACSTQAAAGNCGRAGASALESRLIYRQAAERVHDMQPLAAHLHTQCAGTYSSPLTHTTRTTMCDMSLSQVGYELKVEGEITQQLVAQLDSSIDMARVTFQQVCWGLGPWQGLAAVFFTRGPLHFTGAERVVGGGL